MITWTCHICGEERPDNKISVISTDLSAEWGFPAGTVAQNVRYWNDRELCRAGAKIKRFFHDTMARKTLSTT